MESTKSEQPKRQISAAIKKNAISRLHAGEVTVTELCEEFGVERRIVRYWNKNIDHISDSDTFKPRAIVPEEVKRKFVREVEAGELTLDEACIKYNYRWKINTKAWFKKFGSANLQENTITSVNKVSSTEAKPDIGQGQDLKERLRYAHLKIALLETMIDVAEKQLNIDIRKKAGAKQ